MTPLAYRIPARLRTQSGFTLIEIIISLAIIVVGVMGLMATYIYMSTASSAADETTVVMNAARAKIDEINGMTFSNVITTYQNKVVTFAVPGILPSPAGQATATVVGTLPTVLELTVTINWSGATGERSAKYATRMTSK